MHLPIRECKYRYSPNLSSGRLRLHTKSLKQRGECEQRLPRLTLGAKNTLLLFLEDYFNSFFLIRKPVLGKHFFPWAFTRTWTAALCDGLPDGLHRTGFVWMFRGFCTTQDPSQIVGDRVPVGILCLPRPSPPTPPCWHREHPSCSLQGNTGGANIPILNGADGKKLSDRL